MAVLIELKTITDPRGSLTVIENVLPFVMQRVFFIYDVSAARGGHGHRRTQIALVCVSGSCRVLVQSVEKNFEFFLDAPSKCLILQQPIGIQWTNFLSSLPWLHSLQKITTKMTISSSLTDDRIRKSL